MPPKKKFHHSQLPAIPFAATSSVTARGVSAANVVATMLVPAIYQGRFLPVRKKSPVLLLARLDKIIPIEILITKYSPIISQSITAKFMITVF
jgi:hypothetical protein